MYSNIVCLIHNIPFVWLTAITIILVFLLNVYKTDILLFSQYESSPVVYNH